MTRQLTAWLPRVALVALGVALTWPAHTDAGPRSVAIAAIVRGDDRARPVIQKDGGHSSTGWVHPSCAGQYLRIEPRPVSRYAVIVSVTPDGWYLAHGYTAGIHSSRGTRILVAFRRDGEPVACSEVFSHAAGNWHVEGTVLP